MDKKSKVKEKSVGLMGKIEAAKEMRDLASSLMKGGIGDKLKSIKEVKVAADSSEGLKKGLEKAKELVENKEESPEEQDETVELESPEEEESEETEDVEKDEEDEYSEVVDQCDSPEKIDKLIAKLEAKKAEMLKD